MISLNQEVRCDYTVTTKQKKIWQVEVDLLLKLLEVCKKYNLTCWVLAGTMLGAVRHKGFIPWDDDIDVCLPRKDFEKLKEISDKEFLSPYFLQFPESDPYYFGSAMRLRNSNTTGIIVEHKESKENQGIYMDIFPLDVWPQNVKLQESLIRKVTFYHRMLTYRHYLKIDSFKHFVFFVYEKLFFAFSPYEKTLLKFNSLCRSYEDSQSVYTAYISRGRVKNDGFRYIWSKDETADTVWLDFEDIQVPVPVGYKECLEKRYGDYMKFPPVEKRGKWHADKIIFDPDTPYLEYQKKNGWIK